MRRWLLISVLFLLPLAGSGQDTTALARRDAFREKGQTLLYEGLPSRAWAEVRYNLRSEDDAFFPQEGDGLQEGAFHASSVRHLNENTALEGAVSYERGVKRNIKWNTSSDWNLLTPYVTADSVGGNLQKEQYRFRGFYAHRFGTWNIGAGATYRALHEYRQTDPRPRNITSDFTATLSGGKALGAYVLTLEAQARTYHQSQQTEFLNPKGANTSLLPFTGLGSFYGRFAGTKEFNGVRFRGNGFGTILQLEPAGGEGWTGKAGYESLTLVRHLTAQNEVPISTLRTQEAVFEAGWKRAGGQVFADASYRIVQGTESAIDNFKTGAYGVLIELPQYRRPELRASLEGALRRRSETGELHAGTRIGFSHIAAQYAYPAREMALTAGEASVTGGFFRAPGAWFTSLDAGLLYHRTFTGTFSIPADGTDARIFSHYQDLYARWSDHWLRVDLSARVQRRLSADLSVYARAEGAYFLYATRHHRLITTLSIGFEF